MRVAVVGAGASGTTVASMLASRHETSLWEREAEVVETVVNGRENERFLPGIELCPDMLVSSPREVVETLMHRRATSELHDL